MKTLTLKQLKDMEPGIFASGMTKDPRLHRDLALRWVAVRGNIHDWAIYYHKEEHDEDYVRWSGDKCSTEAVIKELVPCSKGAIEMYRY